MPSFHYKLNGLDKLFGETDNTGNKKVFSNINKYKENCKFSINVHNFNGFSCNFDEFKENILLFDTE